MQDNIIAKRGKTSNKPFMNRLGQRSIETKDPFSKKKLLSMGIDNLLITCHTHNIMHCLRYCKKN